MHLRWLNPPVGGQPTTPKAVANQTSALRRLREKRKPAKPESDDDGLRRFLGIDPAIAETLEIAGLEARVPNT